MKLNTISASHIGWNDSPLMRIGMGQNTSLRYVVKRVGHIWLWRKEEKVEPFGRQGQYYQWPHLSKASQRAILKIIRFQRGDLTQLALEGYQGAQYCLSLLAAGVI